MRWPARVCEYVPVAMLVVGIKIGKACDGCWLNSVPTAEVERGHQKGSETSDVFKFSPAKAALEKKSRKSFRLPCEATVKSLVPPEPSCRFNGCNLESVLWEKLWPLIIIAEIQFQPGHERTSAWKKIRHFNWPGPFQSKRAVKLKCRTNYSRGWRVFTHLLTARRLCLCALCNFHQNKLWQVKRNW